MMFDQLVSSIIESTKEVPTTQSMLVGISGIDASGKGYVTHKISLNLTSQGFKTEVINVDGWLNLPHIRFDTKDLAGNFYRNGIRFDEMFERLVVPLKQARSIDITANFSEENATQYHPHRYAFVDIDIILLEGIFLFKREFQLLYDLRIWIDCPFDRALKRAVSRSQEGLSVDETIDAYRSIYFPAQRIHFELDDPRAAADIIFDNK